MAVTQELCYLSIGELGAELQARRLSPVEVVEAYLGRIAQLEDRLHAYITVTADRARQEARAVEAEISRGEYRGPLHGVPLALKDLYDTAGVRTTGHSRLLAERVPGEDSTCARLLAEAGSLLLGKLSMHEFAFGPPDFASFSPPARNPWDLERVPAGSSSGSGAALAAGLCAGSLGSDTGGSIRGPASNCGIVGHKPTYGLCSRAGVLPLAWSLDHTGPMGRTVEDCAIILQVIAGHDPRDPASARVPIPDYRAALGGDLRGVRVGAPLTYVETNPVLDPETLGAYRAALAELERLGAQVEAVDLPEQEHYEAVWLTILLAEAYAYHQEDLASRPELYGPVLVARMRAGGLLSAADYLTAQRGRARITRELAELMTRVDLLALPTTPYPAKTFADELTVPLAARTAFTHPFDLTGQPAISLPCGFSAGGLPIGLQLVGRVFEDASVLRAAHVYEQATAWHTRRPSLELDPRSGSTLG